MTRKDYIRLAAALREAVNEATYRGTDARDSQLLSIGVWSATRLIADALAAENYRFDRERFYDAAGYAPDRTRP